MYGACTLFIMSTFVPCLLDIVIPLNETRQLKLVVPVKYFFGEEQYFKFVLLHECISCFYVLSVVFSSDAILAVTIEHGCGLLAITGYNYYNYYLKLFSFRVRFTSNIALWARRKKYFEMLRIRYSRLFY